MYNYSNYYSEKESVAAAWKSFKAGRSRPLKPTAQYGEEHHYTDSTKLLYNSQRIQGILFLVDEKWRVVLIEDYKQFL